MSKLKDKIEICFPESESDLDLLSLPFKSTYRVLSWRGLGDNSLLTPDFNLIDIVGKILVIKSFKIIPYYAAASVDLYVTDGVTTNSETIPAFSRMDRIFDVYPDGTQINMIINGGPVSLFNAIFPLDIDLQNIYYKYPEKIQDLSLQILSLVVSNLITGATLRPRIIVNMEVYLI